MIRVLQVVNDMQRAGLETMLMNYYRNIDREQIQFDFLMHRPNKSDYEDEIFSLGGKVYRAPRLYPHNYQGYFKYMKRFFEKYPEYKIIHSHIDAMSYLPLLAAQKANVPIRIAHSHNTSIDKDFKYILKQYFRRRITFTANRYLACGEEAGNFLFAEKNFCIIPNAVEAEMFYFNKCVRNRKRSELNVSNNFVLGHVGRISYQKNHKFLIEIFKEVKKKRTDAVLLLVGVGKREQEVRNQVKRLGLEESVKFLGNRSDVHEIYQAMDVFVLPSHFEGIPVVGVEAQFADLPCIFSNRTPKEVKFNARSRFLPLEMTASEWANEILLTDLSQRSSNRTDIINSKYNIKIAYNILGKYYLSLL